MSLQPPYYQKEEKIDLSVSDPFANGASIKIVRQIQENGHPIITPHMFMDYAKARIEAAKTMPYNEESKYLLDKLGEVYKEFFDHKYVEAFELAKTNRFNTFQEAKKALENSEINHNAYLSWLNTAEKGYQTAFNQLYRHNIKKLKQINSLLAHYVDPHKDPKKVIKKINQAAYELRAKELRPIQENHYAVEDMSITSTHIPEGWLTQEQQKNYKKVLGEGEIPPNLPYTIPSTIRDHRQIGLVNALRTEIKINDKIAFTGHRHGSPSVYKIQDEAERQYRTLQNVKQSLTLAAKEELLKIQAKVDELKKIELSVVQKNELDHLENILSGITPLPLNIYSMSLLSPVAKEDAFSWRAPLDPLWQYRQVEDSRFAYWSLDGREITLDGSLKVQVNASFISMGVNAARGIGTSQAKALTQRVNHRGLNRFIDHFLDQNYATKDPQLIEVIREIRQLETEPEINDCHEKLKNFDKTALTLSYLSLEKLNESLAKNTFSENELKEIQQTRKKHLKIIQSEEKKLDSIYEKLAKVRNSVYASNTKKINKALDLFQQSQSKEQLKNNKHFQQLRLFVDALDIYYNQPKPGLLRFLKVKIKTFKKNAILRRLNKTTDVNKRGELAAQADNIQAEIDLLNKSNYRFQTRFALLAQQLDGFIEWFCKSGEDRTGLLNEHIEAYCIFIEKNGYPPRWDEPHDAKMFYELMPHVHNGSPNRETNAYNDDAPGLKVSDKDFAIPTVNYETDKQMANLVSRSAQLGSKPEKHLQKANDRLERLKGISASKQLLDKLEQNEQQSESTYSFNERSNVLITTRSDLRVKKEETIKETVSSSPKISH